MGGQHENIKSNKKFPEIPSDEFKKNTIVNYKCFLSVFEKEFGHYEVSMISSDSIMNFLVTITEGHNFFAL